jgi:hypothetical protein
MINRTVYYFTSGVTIYNFLKLLSLLTEGHFLPVKKMLRFYSR